MFLREGGKVEVVEIWIVTAVRRDARIGRGVAPEPGGPLFLVLQTFAEFVGDSRELAGGRFGFGCLREANVEDETAGEAGGLGGFIDQASGRGEVTGEDGALEFPAGAFEDAEILGECGGVLPGAVQGGV